MDLSERIRTILSENGMSQRELSTQLSMSPSYISGLLSKRNKSISPAMAEKIEHRLGYSAQWIQMGQEPKFKYHSKITGLSSTHQRAIALLEQMNEAQVKAVLAFIRSLDEVEDVFKD